MTDPADTYQEISLARNYRDGCVWISIGDAPRKCITPQKARDMANGLEHLKHADGDSIYPDTADPTTERLIDDLRAMANDVEPSGGETDE